MHEGNSRTESNSRQGLKGKLRRHYKVGIEEIMGHSFLSNGFQAQQFDFPLPFFWGGGGCGGEGVCHTYWCSEVTSNCTQESLLKVPKGPRGMSKIEPLSTVYKASKSLTHYTITQTCQSDIWRKPLWDVSHSVPPLSSHLLLTLPWPKLFSSTTWLARSMADW